MNDKITISIDLTKIDKSRITERVYVKDGVEVKEKNYSLDIMPLKEPKMLKVGPTWEMWKSYSVSEAKNKVERDSKAPTKYMGSGIVFKTKAPVVNDDVDPSSISF